jgi:hypothetical protein
MNILCATHNLRPAILLLVFIRGGGGGGGALTRIGGGGELTCGADSSTEFSSSESLPGSEGLNKIRVTYLINNNTSFVNTHEHVKRSSLSLNHSFS